MKAHVGAYWAPRAETVDQCADRLAEFLAELGDISPLLAQWRPGDVSKKKAMEQPIVGLDHDGLVERLLQGRVRRGAAIDEDLGYSVAFWNGSADSKASAGLSIRCGIRAARLVNSVSLHLPEPPHASALYTPKDALAVIESVVRSWQPDRAAWTNDAQIAAQKEPDRQLDDGGYVLGQLIGQPAGWATYLSDEGAPSLDLSALPKSAELHRIPDAGIVVAVGGDPADPPLSDVLDVRRAMGYSVSGDVQAESLPPAAPLSAPSDAGAVDSPTAAHPSELATRAGDDARQRERPTS